MTTAHADAVGLQAHSIACTNLADDSQSTIAELAKGKMAVLGARCRHTVSRSGRARKHTVRSDMPGRRLLHAPMGGRAPRTLPQLQQAIDPADR